MEYPKSNSKERKPIRVLVLEDNPRDRVLIESLLENDGLVTACHHIQTKDEFQAALRSQNYDLIISDYSLPSFDGRSALALRQQQAPHVPFLLFSGTVGEDPAIESLREGATDYVLKQRPQRLAVAVKRALQDAHEWQARRIAERTIQEQAALLDAASDAIILKDLEGRILFWNQGAERIYGWSAPEAVGLVANQLLQSNPAVSEEAFGEFLTTGCWRGELHERSRMGRELTMEARWTLMRDGDGRPKSILDIKSDITSRKHLEAQFLRAQRMESLGTLTSGIAHDLNNILAPILMSAPMLRWGLTPDEAEKAIATIESSAQRGASLIKQLLTFGRGADGQKVTLQLKHVIKEITKLAKETFPKNITLQTRVPHDLWTVQGDATQLHQVLMNLCVNSRDAMPQGGTLVIMADNAQIEAGDLRLGFEAKAGPYVVLRVKDTGHGIPPEIQDRIFEPFFTTKDSTHGTGLGLSTVIGIVKGHDGFVRLESEVGKGSCFEVYIPGTPEVQAVSAQWDSPLARSGQGETILVVDDETTILEMWKAILESCGYKVLIAANGVEALTLFAQRHETIGLVLTDLMMPFLDGIGLIRELRRIHPGVRVIASTGIGTEGEVNPLIDQVHSLGVQRILHKPYNKDELLNELYNALHEHD